MRHYFALRTLGIVLAILVTRCATVEQHDPFSPAETLAQHGYAAAGLGVIYLELAADVIRDPDTDAEVDRAIRLSAEALNPPLQATLGALKAYDAARNSPGTPAQRIDATAAVVIKALNDLRPALFSFIATVNAARGETP